MKEDLSIVLDALRQELRKLQNERNSLSQQLTKAVAQRLHFANDCLETLVPNLKMSTIRSLERLVPGFYVPKVSHFFFLKKVDPAVSVFKLRMQLGAYLDNRATVLPYVWRKAVADSDKMIRDLQEKLIPANAEHISQITCRIEALQKLVKSNLSKVDPKVRSRIAQALASQAKRVRLEGKKFQPMRNLVRTKPQYPTPQQINSDSGPGLLEMWLWYNLLFQENGSQHVSPRPFEGQGGTFDGGGASASWDGGPQGESAPTMPGVSIPVTASTLSDVISHEALGSRNFS